MSPFFLTVTLLSASFLPCTVYFVKRKSPRRLPGDKALTTTAVIDIAQGSAGLRVTLALTC